MNTLILIPLRPYSPARQIEHWGRSITNLISSKAWDSIHILFHSGVAPILDYCAGVWGYQNFGNIDAIQNRAIRFYLGLHRFSPNLAVNGDMGWINSSVRRKIEILHFWNRVINMNPERITKKIFLWDLAVRKSSGSWSSDAYKVFQALNMVHIYNRLDEVNLNQAKSILHYNEQLQWELEIQEMPKLRTYRTFKCKYEIEPYVREVHNRAHRSVISQFRAGTLPLKIETGRFTNIPLEFRLCILCTENIIENETHFFFECEFYNDLRNDFYRKYKEIHPDICLLDDERKLAYMMVNDVKMTAEFIYNCYLKRKKFIYN